jgi:hypothetical protein
MPCFNVRSVNTPASLLVVSFVVLSRPTAAGRPWPRHAKPTANEPACELSSSNRSQKTKGLSSPMRLNAEPLCQGPRSRQLDSHQPDEQEEDGGWLGNA